MKIRRINGYVYIYVSMAISCLLIITGMFKTDFYLFSAGVIAISASFSALWLVKR